jgi:ATP-dependent Clp protease protease subunit
MKMNPLLKLLALNKEKSQPVKAETVDGEPTVYLYGVIVSDDSWGGVSAESFARELNAITAPRIHVRIHSPGGDAFAGVAMAQIMRDHPSEIVVHIDGDAASAATFPVMAANKTIIAKRARFMIHNAWTIAAGNQFDFTDMANHLARVDQNIAEDYADKTGQNIEQLMTWMKETTFFYGQEAINAGFVDELAENNAESTANQADWDYSAYKEQSFADQMTQAMAKYLTDNSADEGERSQQDKASSQSSDDTTAQADLSAHYRQLEVVNLTA